MDATDPTLPASPAPSKRLTEAEWAEAKALYELGKSTNSELARHFGISRQSMREGLQARGAVYGSKSKEIEEATIEGQKSDTRKRVEEIAGMREARIKSIDLLNKLQNKVISEALQSSAPLASKASEFKTLNILLKNASLIRQELWELYGLNDDPDGGEEIPEFIISEYSKDEIDLINAERLGISPEEALKKLEAATEGRTVSDEDDLGLDELLGDGAP